MAKEVSTITQTQPAAKNASRWRVKHPLLGHEIAVAVTADEAKDIVLRRRFPGESQDPKWLEAMKNTQMRVSRIEEPAHSAQG